MTDKFIVILSQTMEANLPLDVASFSSFPWLSLIVLLPAIGALVMPLLPQEKKDSSSFARNIAIGFLLVDFILIVGALGILFDKQSTNLQLVERLNWLPAIGLEWSLGVDGISAPLLFLSGLITLLSACLLYTSPSPRD